MSLFEDALEGLFEAEDDFQDQVDDDTNEINELVDTIFNSEIDADEIRDLALQNDLDISFSDYDDAIEGAKALLAGGDFRIKDSIYKFINFICITVYLVSKVFFRLKKSFQSILK